MIYSTEKRLTEWIISHVPFGDTVLDAGCGIGFFTMVLAQRAAIVDAVDAYEPYIEMARARLVESHNVSYHVGQIEQWLSQWEDRKWEVACCIDVIEHLEHETGEQVLEQLKRVADKVLIFTPEGLLPQDKDEWNLGGDKWQVHRSGWAIPELLRAGFDVERWANYHGFKKNALVGVWKRRG